MAIRRVSAKDIKERQNQRTGGGRQFPKLSEILVNTSTSKLNTGEEVSVRLRMIGDPIEFVEFSDKKWVENPDYDPDAPKGDIRARKFIQKQFEFPDAKINRSVTRIGHDDPNQCYWRKEGYISNPKWAQNCLQYNPATKSWEPKILSKGNSIFGALASWRVGRLEEVELLDEEEAADVTTHLGTRVSPCVRIVAKKTGPRPNEVEYDVFFDSKDLKLTDEMIELLRGAGEPTPEKLAQERAAYEVDRENDPTMPEWEDFFAYGYDLMSIFKYTGKKEAAADAAPEAETQTSELKIAAAENDDDVEEEEAPKPAAKAKAAPKAKPAPVVEEKEETNMFSASDDDDDEDGLIWANS